MIRQPAMAGMFYPSDPELLSDTVDEYLENVAELPLEGTLKAIIVPHAGYVYSGQVAAYGHKLLGDAAPSRIILIGPAHTIYLKGVVADSHEYWLLPLGKARVMEGPFPVNEEAHRGEHCLEVQVPFLQRVLDDFQFMPLVVGKCDPEEVADKIISLIDDKTVIVVSTDLSHFFDYDTAVDLDTVTNNAIESLDYQMLSESGEACGKMATLILLKIALHLGWKCRLLNYRNSGDVTGEKDRVVGYSSFAFYE